MRLIRARRLKSLNFGHDTRMKKSLYQILGVPKNASHVAIDAAFNDLSAKWKEKHSQGDQEASNALIVIAHAHATLSVPEKRAAYDETWAAMQYQPRPLLKSNEVPVSSGGETTQTNPNLVSCKTCGQSISKNAKTCPHCGEENRTTTTAAKAPGFLSVLLIIFAIAWFVGKLSGSDPGEGNKPSAANQSSYNNDIRQATTSSGLSKADMAWHAQNTYGWDCAQVVSKGEMTSEGYFFIDCSSGKKLRVYPRAGQHPRITSESGGYN